MKTSGCYGDGFIIILCTVFKSCCFVCCLFQNELLHIFLNQRQEIFDYFTRLCEWTNIFLLKLLLTPASQVTFLVTDFYKPLLIYLNYFSLSIYLIVPGRLYSTDISFEHGIESLLIPRSCGNCVFVLKIERKVNLFFFSYFVIARNNIICVSDFYAKIKRSAFIIPCSVVSPILWYSVERQLYITK